MESERGSSADGMGVPSRKQRKDSSKRSHDKAQPKDGRGHVVPDDILRAPRSKSTATFSTPSSTLIASNSKPVACPASQSTLADFSQTAPSVSVLAELGKARNVEKTMDIASNISEEKPKKKKVDLESFRFGAPQQMAPNSTPFTNSQQNRSPLKKSSWSVSASPSPPLTRRANTPLRDEPEDQDNFFSAQQFQLDARDANVPWGHRQFTEGQPGQNFFKAYGLPPGCPQGTSRAPQSMDFSGGLFPGIPQGTSRAPQTMDYPGGLFSGIPQGTTRAPQSMVRDYPGGGFNPSFSGHPSQAMPDLMSIFNEGFSRVISKIGDLSAQKSVGNISMGANPSVNDDLVTVKQELSSDESAEEESYVSWSGQRLVNKTPTVVLSEEGTEAWKALKGLDDNGIEGGLFKKVARKEKDIAFYSKGGRAFYPQEKNLELPKLVGFKDRDEKKLVLKDKSLGAIGAAIVAAVDAARECADDLASAKQDFEGDVCEDIKKEAIETCATSNQMLNERVIVHLIKALKITAVESALITLERRAMSESEVPHEDMRKILADSPPDEMFLYGGAVRDSVQKARDASLLSKAFNNRTGGQKEKPWQKKSVYRPKHLRFKGGNRKLFKGKPEPWKKNDGKNIKGLRRDHYKKE